MLTAHARNLDMLAKLVLGFHLPKREKAGVQHIKKPIGLAVDDVEVEGNGWDGHCVKVQFSLGDRTGNIHGGGIVILS